MTNVEAKEVLQEQIDRYGQEYDEKGIEALNVTINGMGKLKAYEEAREEIISKRDSGQWSEAVVFGFNHAIYIIDKHLKEVEELESEVCHEKR